MRALVLAAAAQFGLMRADAGLAEPPTFHDAPSWTESIQNPFHGQVIAAQAGGKLYAVYCAPCHGHSAEGTGSVPALAHGPAQVVTEGSVFWFITQGSRSGLMPSWATLPEEQRWQLVTYLRTLGTPTAVAATPATPDPTLNERSPTSGSGQ